MLVCWVLPAVLYGRFNECAPYMLQYVLMIPVFVNMVPIYAFSNIHLLSTRQGAGLDPDQHDYPLVARTLVTFVWAALNLTVGFAVYTAENTVGMQASTAEHCGLCVIRDASNYDLIAAAGSRTFTQGSRAPTCKDNRTGDCPHMSVRLQERPQRCVYGIHIMRSRRIHSGNRGPSEG